ncbi:MAG: tRNA-dihydrouridine synthase [Phycisphaerae bacterium]|nr:tRNA-dihydrouridine synthase [Phycisphaerae bacterium]
MSRLKLGQLELDVPFFQAALSGYTDWAMRKLARDFGCPLVLTGVMLAKSVANPRVLRKPEFRPQADEHPIGAQLLSRTPATMAKAARDCVTVGYDLVDLNFACPAPKVLRRKRGGAMLREPDLVIDILKAVKDAVDCPVLMKLRYGVNHKPDAEASFWQIVEQAIGQGVDALVIHGRTVDERYRGKANWDILRQIKHAFPQATIIGSGDVFHAQDAKDIMTRLGLDGVVAARGAVGNPWLLRDLRSVFEGRPTPAPPTLTEQKAAILHHLTMVLQLYTERRAVGYFRKFAAGYTKHHPHRKSALLAIMAAHTRQELVDTIETWF